ncbi:hypothetical protein DIURU_001992 [Diutina rugosa]|uniref:Glucosidase 2 subunit beta n=1 Tax=Diutina rugosa TaxID=5481 RepID=A0A642URJ9_DIURU|nr:uncharacterized protein DIURU_001992 [Diutina rugosa]KAA8904040.1 hypothetical protein DIURU_001992 [Diutina rugosa]
MLTLIWLVVGSATASVAGVGPDLADHYNPGKPFRCISDPSIVINWDQVNDNVCDCPDGSDEPGTAACAQGKFWCANEGHYGQYIPSFLVKDGVCDYDVCCDGSDEGSEVCPNRCAEVHQQFEDYKVKVESQVQQALRLQKAMKTKAQVAKEEEGRTIEKIKKRLKRMENEARETRDSRDDVREYIEWQSDQIKQLQQILSSLMKNHNPNYNDAAVKNAVASFQRLDANTEVPAIPDLEKLGNSEITQTPTFTGLIHHYMKKITELFGGSSHNEITSDPQKLPPQYHRYKEILSRHTSNPINYGEDDILRAATNTVNSKYGEYNYIIEYLQSIRQDDTLVGVFAGYTPESNTLHYAQGDKCWNGPRRSADLKLVCGPEENVIMVSEPEKCRYFIEMTHPLACRALSENELRTSFEVDYENLE